ncbi:hypothetical protein ACFTAO_32070 [Paenibacillus rhizoplanae]
MNNTVTILCSGFGLGFYVPGLLLERKFTAMGLQAEVEVFEALMPDHKKRSRQTTAAGHTSRALLSP